MGQQNERGKGSHKTDIVIVGWNHIEDTEKCIFSILKNTECNSAAKSFRIIYVDNGSAPSRFTAITDDFNLSTNVFLPTNTGYCHGNNVGIALSLLSDSEYVLLLNNDTWIPDGDRHWLTRLMLTLDKYQDVGAVGAVSDNVFGYQRRDIATVSLKPLIVPALIGFCLLLRKKAIEQVGILDERFDPDGNYSDFDYSIRLQQAGWKLAIAESVFIHHAMSVTQRDLDFDANLKRNQQKLLDKWGRETLRGVGL